MTLNKVEDMLEDEGFVFPDDLPEYPDNYVPEQDGQLSLFDMTPYNRGPNSGSPKC